jgi:hypothetical protein
MASSLRFAEPNAGVNYASRPVDDYSRRHALSKSVWARGIDHEE